MNNYFLKFTVTKELQVIKIHFLMYLKFWTFIWTKFTKNWPQFNKMNWNLKKIFWKITFSFSKLNFSLLGKKIVLKKVDFFLFSFPWTFRTSGKYIYTRNIARTNKIFTFLKQFEFDQFYKKKFVAYLVPSTFKYW